MAGSRERLLYERRPDFEYEYEPRRRYDYRERERDKDRYVRYERRDRRIEYERPKRRNGYVYEDIYSDFDENQGKLSLFRPIRPEYLNLPTTYDSKYNSLPRNYYSYENRGRKYKKDYYDFRIENERRRRESFELGKVERKNYERRPIPNDSKLEYNRKPITETMNRKTEFERRPMLDAKNSNLNAKLPKNQPKNVAICKPLRLTEKNARYWTTDFPEKTKTKKTEEPKKNVKFSEVSGCNRKMVVDDPICGKKVVPVRELEVSLDQMIQNGYFEKHNIPISRPMERASNVAREEIRVPNGKCLSDGKERQPLRRTRHLPQVSFVWNIVCFKILGFFLN